MTSIQKIYALLALLLISFSLGLGAGWKAFRTQPPKEPAHEPYQPPVTQKDGSKVLERKTDTKAQPKTEVPKVDTVLHQGEISVTLPPAFPLGAVTDPTTGSDRKAEDLSHTSPQPTSLKIDWTLVQQPDHTMRLIVKGPDGSVIGGQDVVINEPDQPRQLNWSAGVARYVREQTWGVWMERRMAFVTIGAEIKQSRAEFGSGKLSTDAALRVGFSF